ncbi:iron-containing alcohol dehydrogenase [Tolumonas auensis DSM 9187]|uniref:Iron-containing alcohol dehydrogenase n=1 Tax=Tolumonas auensis (strain DSM 9187 / NBRC 110442 / TA 4) TaxID=595494 RepID=C4LG12_TOLAT|nr:iron-containing alcohol dehydrogenase [Tolumonas auensis]ACQ93529.1 iron-containing alcohol dehydrogenase [Tolumonas auensis DSM 9187]
MNNFTFYNPTMIDFGKDKEKQIGQHLKNNNINKVLITFGSDRIKHSGLFDTVVASLKDHDISFVEFGGIISNPILSTIYDGIKFAKENQVDAILSVGGGSVLDSSKAIAAGVKYEGDVWDFFCGKEKINAALPIFSIMTLAATGSEMNNGAVVTNEKTRQKWAIASVHTFPKVSIINPELMQSVSKDYLVYSASDIIAHTIEVYFTAKLQPEISSRIVESIIKTVMTTTEILISEPDNYDARAEFAWASSLALNGLTKAGAMGYQYPNHMIEHSLSAIYNVPHGAGLSVVMPAWMKWYYNNNTKQFERFAREVFGKDSALQGIEAFEAWLNKIGTPTRLKQLNIPTDDINELVDNVFDNAKYFGANELYTKDVIASILEKAF